VSVSAPSRPEGQLNLDAPGTNRAPDFTLLNVKVSEFENVYPMVPAGGAINEMVLRPPQPVEVSK